MVVGVVGVGLEAVGERGEAVGDAAVRLPVFEAEVEVAHQIPVWEKQR